MPSGPCTVLGGLPLLADVWFTRGDGWTTDDDAGVDALYWQRRDGSKGEPVSPAIYERLDKSDPYWEAGVIEQVSEHLSYEAFLQTDKGKAYLAAQNADTLLLSPTAEPAKPLPVDLPDEYGDEK